MVYNKVSPCFFYNGTSFRDILKTRLYGFCEKCMSTQFSSIFEREGFSKTYVITFSGLQTFFFEYYGFEQFYGLLRFTDKPTCSWNVWSILWRKRGPLFINLCFFDLKFSQDNPHRHLGQRAKVEKWSEWLDEKNGLKNFEGLPRFSDKPTCS